MTDDEALAILGGGGSWIGWNDVLNRPDWQNDSIVLDGTFGKDELLAILHFAPKDPE